MKATAATALWKAVRDMLLADAQITALCGANRVFDEAPGGADPPYIALSDVSGRDWSTASDTGTEVIMVLDIWSSHHGLYESLEIAAQTETVLAGLTGLPDHNLVLLVSERLQTVRRDRGRRAVVRLTFRALIDAA